jgi:quercetin dioxygenase-like cupin family protein
MNLSEKVTPSQMLKEKSEQGVIALSMYVAPKYKTPKHFHDHFTENFEVVEGNITFISGKDRIILQPGEKISVPVGTIHAFQNDAHTSAIVKVSVSDYQDDFVAAFSIYHGLIRDGLVDKKMHPKNFGDLALFLKLTNSRMPGLFAKYVVESFFLRAAAKAEATGRLKELKDTYVRNAS